MIILDEQLLGRQLETAIAAWYPGSVRYVTELRPQSVIKDDAIPLLLRQQSQPTFITINETDFWQRIPVDRGYCIICVAVPDSKAGDVATLLRATLQHPAFRTKSLRMGTMARVTYHTLTYYTLTQPTPLTIPLTPH